MSRRRTLTPAELAQRERTPDFPLTSWQLQTFAYHLSALYRETGRGGLGRPDGASVTYEITPSSSLTAATDGNVWDQVTLDGHSCGNRHGGARAYARFWAGDAEWWSAV